VLNIGCGIGVGGAGLIRGCNLISGAYIKVMNKNERNAGRKPIYDQALKQVKVGLTPHHRAIAKRLGSSLADGIRKALEMVEEAGK